jgi:acyl carrier protein
MNDYEQWIIDWFALQTPHITLLPNENYFAVGVIDSLGIIELIEEMEKVFSVRFSQDDFQDKRFTFVSGLAEMITEKRGS